MPNLTNATQLPGDIAKVLQEQLEELVVGVAGDLANAATTISTNAIAAAASGRPDLVEECRLQARMLLEENRLKAVNGSWTTIEAVIGTVIKTLAAVATSAGSL